MYIRYENETRGMEFGQLDVGEVFAEWGDDAAVYIKTTEVGGPDALNAVDLQNGEPVWFSSISRVRPLDAELVLSDP